MAEKTILSFILLFALTACQTEMAKVDEITLPNGAKGLAIDCTNFDWPTCFKSAGTKCSNGYSIHERTTDENTKTEIPIEQLKSDTGLRAPIIQNTQIVDVKEKYMIISCK